jgi:hypothetical protein
MCRALFVARRGYFAWKQRGERPKDEDNRRLNADIQRRFDRQKARYGATRLRWSCERKAGRSAASVQRATKKPSAFA